MRLRGLLALPAFALLAHFGCGRSAEERQLDSMREEIDKIRDSRDRADHRANDRDAPAEPSLVVPQAYASAGSVGQPPPVLQIGADGQSAGDDSAETDDPQDTTPRPTIRVFGSARGGRSSRRGDDLIEQPAPDEETGASGSSSRPGASAAPSSLGHDATAIDPDAKRAYDAALSLVHTKRCDQALDAFAAFLVKWPEHPYADNAMYWRGECYFSRGDWVHASEQFDGALKRFPFGSKTPDALLKLGMAHDKLGRATKAKECFDRLAREYPESEAARHIPTFGVPAAHPPVAAPEESR